MNSLISAFQGAIILVVTTITAPITKILPPSNAPSSQVIIFQSATPSTQTSTSPVQQISPTPKPTEADKTATKEEGVKPTLEVDSVRAEDTIEYMGQKTNYYIDIPKNGGKISGKMTGLCKGTITGTFNGQTLDQAKTSDRKDLQGEITGNCKVGILSFSGFAKFFGEVSFSTKWVSLTVDVEKPFAGRYYPSLRIH